MNTIFLVKLEFTRAAMAQRLEIFRHIISMMEGNANFPEPKPTIIAFKEAVDKLHEAYQNSLSGDKYYITLRNELADVANQMVKQLAIYVNHIANGSIAMVSSSGFPMRKKRENGHVGQVLDVRTIFSGSPGELNVKWKPAPYARIYEVKVTNDPGDPSSFKTIAMTTRSSVTLTGLASREVYYIIIVAIGTSGYGVPSDLASMIVA